MVGPLTIELTVEEYLSGNRVDTFLGKHLRNYSPWRIQRIVQHGGASVDGREVLNTERLYPGQTLTVRLLEPPDKLIAPQPADLDILYEDPWILVINKPPGVICHPVGDYQTDTLCHYVQDHLSHRLVSIEFQSQRVSKAYLSLAEGVIAEDEMMIDYPIGQSSGDSILMSAKADARDAKPSRTRIRVLNRFDNHTFVEAKPLTGRNHQIRVHLAEIGHPVVADEYYLARGGLKPQRPNFPPEFDWGDDIPNSVDKATGLTRHFLHAYRLEFTHPITEEWMQFFAPLTADLNAALHRLSHEKAKHSEVDPVESEH